MKELSDNHLMLKVQSGDFNKMGLLFERHHKPVYGFLLNMCRDVNSSEDMLQTIFYRMLKYRSTFNPNGEFKSWMYQLARNVLKDHWKKRNKIGLESNIRDVEEQLSGGSLADEDLERKEEQNSLYKAMALLSEEYREVLILNRFQELKYSEIASILHTSEGNIKVKVHRALKRLQSIYFQEND